METFMHRGLITKEEAKNAIYTIAQACNENVGACKSCMLHSYCDAISEEVFPFSALSDYIDKEQEND